jgi:ATP-dependent DNA ligase
MGNDWTQRYPLVVEAVNHLKVRSCLIDGEVVCCDEQGVTSFQLLRHRRAPGISLRLRPAGAERHGPSAGTD